VMRISKSGNLLIGTWKSTYWNNNW
jgi:hypothetical protein